MFRVWLLFLPCLLRPLAAPALDTPPLTGRVSDLAGILSPQAESALEALLKAHEDSTGNQVAVLTIPSLEGEAIESFSMQVAEQWKLGRADRDNGVLVLVARDDREVRIEVGAGLEGDLPDITCGRIIRHEFVPRFREGDYDGGVLSGTSAILAAVSGAYVAQEAEAPAGPGEVRPAAGPFLALVFLVLFAMAIAMPGPGGWMLFLFLGAIALALSGAAGAMVALLAAGLAARIWLSRSRRGRKVSKKIAAFWAAAGAATAGGSSSWGRGGYSSHGFSGRGFSGGGFSGGGGSFSGGGASGRW